jgi:hypothetical protein
MVLLYTQPVFHNKHEAEEEVLHGNQHDLHSPDRDVLCESQLNPLEGHLHHPQSELYIDEHTAYGRTDI